MSNSTVVRITLELTVEQFKAMANGGRHYLDFVGSGVKFGALAAEGLPEGWVVKRRGGVALSLYFERENVPQLMAPSVDLTGWYGAVGGQPVVLASMPTPDMYVWHATACTEWKPAKEVPYFSAAYQAAMPPLPNAPAIPALPANVQVKPRRGRKAAAK